MDVEFYKLARPIQDRFADATRSFGLPTPILREPPIDRRPALWLVAAAAAAGGLAWLILRGLGNLDSRVALARPSFAGFYAAATAFAAFCVLRALSIWSGRATLPYRPGLYLFPAGVFDARSEALRVFRHPEVKVLTVVGTSSLRVAVDGGNFTFRLRDGQSAEEAKAMLEQARGQYLAAIETDNRREQAMLDPLVDSGFSSPFSPQHPLIRLQPPWARLGFLFALAAGALLGPAFWKLRNVTSERRLYVAARHRDDVAGYRAYVARGGPRAEVSEILLPRAELREAVSTGTVEALEEFVRSHPASKIQVEVDAARQTVILDELALAKKAGTVTALREFQQRRGSYAFIRPAVEAATVAIYRKVLADFSVGKDPAIASFFERLLGYLKGHGPRVAIRFVRRLPDSVDAADLQVKRSAYFMGKDSIPSQYFSGDYAARREAKASERIAEALGSPFPPDVLAVAVEPTFTGLDPVPEPTDPTLLVEYSPEMVGGYMSPKPRGVFVGVGMTFKARFAIPGDPQAFELKSSLWRAPNPQILKGEGSTVGDVYEKMASDGFEKFLKDLLLLVSGKP